VFHPANDAEWDAAISRYTASINDRPLRRCVEVARANGATTLVVETRYLDLDYRSEFSTYYSKQFADVPDSARRLHFFADQLDETRLWEVPGDATYLGYVVARPAYTGVVSRAMLRPPPDIAPLVRTAVTETVHFFGQPLKISGVPFAQQDAQLGACAHAAAWVCHYSAHLRGETARRAKADFSLKADASLHPGRSLPTGGLTVGQLSELFRTFELPAIFYRVGQLPSPGLPWQALDPTPVAGADPGTWDHRIVAVLCRHLNSGFPVLVGTQDHAFVICGYGRAAAPGWIEFVRHDDQRGPYLTVSNVLDDIDPGSGHAYGPWQTMHVPLPDKLWLAPEAAERKGGEYLMAVSTPAAAVAQQAGHAVDTLAALAANNRLSLRTYAVSSNDFKQRLPARGLDPAIVREYRLARLSRYVWVIEAVDRQLREAGQPAVLGEAVLDATSSDHDPQLLALHLHGIAWVEQTDGTIRFPIVGGAAPYASGGVGEP
jgi:hypothetical protein